MESYQITCVRLCGICLRVQVTFSVDQAMVDAHRRKDFTLGLFNTPHYCEDTPQLQRDTKEYKHETGNEPRDPPSIGVPTTSNPTTATD